MILEHLYDGTLSPAEQAVAQDRAFRAKAEKVATGVQRLAEQLSPEQMKLVEQVVDDVTDMHCIEMKKQFQYGVSLGILLMQEVYEGANQWWRQGINNEIG